MQDSRTKVLLVVAATSELLTGAMLLVDPPIVTKLLLGADADGAVAIVGRVAGIASAPLCCMLWCYHLAAL